MAMKPRAIIVSVEIESVLPLRDEAQQIRTKLVGMGYKVRQVQANAIKRIRP